MLLNMLKKTIKSINRRIMKKIIFIDSERVKPLMFY